MTPEDFISNHLKRILSVSPEIRIRYEHRRESMCHIIEVLPAAIFHNNLDYLKAEADLESVFETWFPDNEIIFITSDSLLEISEATHEYESTP